MRTNVALAIVAALLAACTPNQAAPMPAMTQADVAIPTDTAQVNLPNPASVYCEQQGNRLEIRTAADGSQSGVCVFPDGNECDEWAYYRGECSASAATAEPSVFAGWLEYVESGYGFKFRYPSDWTAEVDLRPGSTTYQHVIWLHAPSEPLPDVVLSIDFEQAGEDYGLQRTGIGAGELTERDSIVFLGEPLKRIVLVLEGNDMEVMYGTTGLFDRGDMRFALSLAYHGVERRGLTPELEQTADLIVSSFERAK